jgi:hypothetical protein
MISENRSQSLSNSKSDNGKGARRSGSRGTNTASVFLCLISCVMFYTLEQAGGGGGRTRGPTAFAVPWKKVSSRLCQNSNTVGRTS